MLMMYSVRLCSLDKLDFYIVVVPVDTNTGLIFLKNYTPCMFDKLKEFVFTEIFLEKLDLIIQKILFLPGWDFSLLIQALKHRKSGCQSNLELSQLVRIGLYDFRDETSHLKFFQRFFG